MPMALAFPRTVVATLPGELPSVVIKRQKIGATEQEQAEHTCQGRGMEGRSMGFLWAAGARLLAIAGARAL